MNSNSIQEVKVFAYDAASANVVLAFVYFNFNNENYNVTAYPKGPAVNILQKEMINTAKIKDDDHYAFKMDDIVITGLSGISSNYELEVIRIAKKNKVSQIISLLDVARSIDDRFLLNIENIEEFLPYRILIPTDNLQVSKDKKINNLLEEYENPYWKYVYEKYYKIPPPITNDLIQKSIGNYIVFFTEYIKEQFGDTLGYDEFTIMSDFIDVFRNTNISIYIKLHPSEEKNKYDKYIPNDSKIYVIKDEISTQEILYYAKVVFGCMTSVFYEALLLHKQCFSLQLNYKKDIFELTLENKITRVETKKQLTECLQ
ncbi:hypothetical protein [Sulfurimonas sp.]|uniref:hypothetical protein n=1 Tax=Sulfurimonas sp. TaxID=2022749 RepID=UPI002AAF3CCD|nr:hypothetical protein [Sulfurimonas sp.]